MQFHTDLDSQRKQYTRVNVHILNAIIERDTIVMWAHEYDAMVIFDIWHIQFPYSIPPVWSVWA